MSSYRSSLPDPTLDFAKLVTLIDELSEVYRPEGVGVWLLGKNGLLGDRVPLDVIRGDKGGLDRCLALVQGLKDGVFV